MSIILAHKDKLYRITSSLSVICLNDHGKAGAGAVFANYYLHERKDLQVKDRIINSLVASAKRCDSVCGPYVLIDAENLEYEIIDMGEENY